MRLVHFTDLHFTEAPERIPWRSLGSKRLLGWLNLKLGGRHREFSEAPLVTRAFLADLLALSPDHILCTGDLTGLALPSEFAAARASLEPLLADPRVIGIPGNHDVYVRSAATARLFEDSFGAWVRTDLEAAELPLDLRDLHPYPLVRLLGDHWALIALRDVRPAALHDSGGAVGVRQLRALEHLLGHERLAGRRRILALHCGPCREGGRPDRRLHGLRDWRGLHDVARAGGVALILHGHLHRRFVVDEWRASGACVANPGSLTSSRHDRAYHVVTLLESGYRLEARRFDSASGVFRPAPGAAVVA